MRLTGTLLVLLGFLAAGHAQDAKPKGRFTIGKETTYVTGPLGKDGLIDYTAAVNERLGKGVTPANNAVVLIWRAFGPRPEGTPVPEKFFRLLGIDAPPEKGDYFVDLNRYMKEHLKIGPGEEAEAIDNQLLRCVQRPWTAKEYPHIASWVKANEKPLTVVIEASKRTQWYSPHVTKGDSDLICALMPGVQKCRALVHALAARALLRAAEGNAEDAWQDLLACHRLGRLVARGGSLIDAFVGIAIDTIACRADLAYLERNTASAKRLENCLQDLRQLPPMPPMADKIDLYERFTFLDCVMLVNRHGIRYLEALADGKADKETAAQADQILGAINWDPALRNANRWYDRMVAAMREKDRGTRQKKLGEIEAELAKVKADLTDGGELAGLFAGNQPADAIGKVMGDVMIGLLMPALVKVTAAADRGQQNLDNVTVAFALAWYQRVEGRYPRELKALAPKYLAQVPLDVFSGKPLIYRPNGNGYLFYSVGPNGQDEGGQGPEDEPRGDDLSIRMPLPPLKER